MAIRMAHILRLNIEWASDSTIQKEVKRRVWWSLYMIDRWSSAGLGLPRLLHDLDPQLSLPMDEDTFQRLQATDKEAEPRVQQLGLWTYMILLTRIFGAIQDLNWSLAQGAIQDERHLANLAFELAGQLNEFERNLPPHVRYCRENLVAHAEKGLGRTFVALHLGFHHYATLLYFYYLDVSRPQNTAGIAYAERCRYHATAFSDLLTASTEVPNCEALYNIVGHMAIVSSSVHVHTLLFGDEKELASAKKRLESNFKALIKLKSYWSSVESMVSRYTWIFIPVYRTGVLQLLNKI